MDPERVQEWLDRLPDRRTSAAVFDAAGERGRIDSGGRLENGERDTRVDTAREWIRESGWELSSNRVETHVEAKLVVDMVQGRMPNHVTAVMNNKVCEAESPDVVSCRTFINESLKDTGYTLRIYDDDGEMTLFPESGA